MVFILFFPPSTKHVIMHEKPGMLQFMGSQSWTQLSHRTTTIMHLFLHYKIIHVLKIEETKKSGKDNIYHATSKMLPCGSAGKESTCNAGDLGLIPGLERSPGEGKGYPLQYSGWPGEFHGL